MMSAQRRHHRARGAPLFSGRALAYFERNAQNPQHMWEHGVRECGDLIVYPRGGREHIDSGPPPGSLRAFLVRFPPRRRGAVMRLLIRLGRERGEVALDESAFVNLRGSALQQLIETALPICKKWEKSP